MQPTFDETRPTSLDGPAPLQDGNLVAGAAFILIAFGLLAACLYLLLEPIQYILGEIQAFDAGLEAILTPEDPWRTKGASEAFGKSMKAAVYLLGGFALLLKLLILAYTRISEEPGA